MTSVEIYLRSIANLVVPCAPPITQRDEAKDCRKTYQSEDKLEFSESGLNEQIRSHSREPGLPCRSSRLCSR